MKHLALLAALSLALPSAAQAGFGLSLNFGASRQRVRFVEQQQFVVQPVRQRVRFVQPVRQRFVQPVRVRQQLRFVAPARQRVRFVEQFVDDCY